jgi:hypothetical protein
VTLLVKNTGRERGIFICAFLFLIGGLLGGVSGNLLTPEASVGIREGLEVVLNGGEQNLTKVLLENYALPLLSLFLATSVIGWLLSPLVTLFRGYMLGWAVSSSIFAHGADFSIFVYYGLPALVSVPCLIYITATSVYISRGVSDVVSQRRRSLPALNSGKSTAICLIMIFVLSVAQVYALPAFMRLLS